MRYHEDLDGNFVQKFQTAGWDAHLWELYLYATFNELGFVSVGSEPTPDFVLKGNKGGLAIEATSVNPSKSGPSDTPDDPDAFGAYLENYIPIRLSNALRLVLSRFSSGLFRAMFAMKETRDGNEIHMKRNDLDPESPMPTPFEEEIGPQSSETWVEGM